MKVVDALALALEVEKTELKFYLEMARIAKEEKARKMFLFLASEEAEHWRILKRSS